MILKIVKFLFYGYFALYALVHVLVLYYPALVGHLIFMNSVRWPFGDLSKPTEYGLDKVHNFYITNKRDNLRLGVWHFIPEFFKYDAKSDATRSVDSHLEKYLRREDNIPVIIYAHGNDRDRGASFRIKLCNKLVSMGYHVFALDYRGYGDSEGWPSEEGTASDVIELFNLLRAKKPSVKIYLYGHSLGTGIVSHAARRLSESNVNIDGVILEAPFVNASKGAQDYHLSLAFNNNKFIRKKIDESLVNLNIRFNTDKNIVKIKSRVLICHAEDDWFIPHSHSAILYDISQSQRPKDYPLVKYMNFGKEHTLGHFLHTHQAHFDEIKNMIEEKW